MIFTPEDIHYEGTNMFRWTRIQVQSDDGKEAVVLIGAGKNFLNDHFHIPSDSRLEQTHLNQWLEQAIEDIKKEVPEIENGGVYYKVYAQSPEGQANGMTFLKEVTP
jgi:hypothetical protein